jgi:hypothetical protein
MCKTVAAERIRARRVQRDAASKTNWRFDPFDPVVAACANPARASDSDQLLALRAPWRKDEDEVQKLVECGHEQ